MNSTEDKQKAKIAGPNEELLLMRTLRDMNKSKLVT